MTAASISRAETIRRALRVNISAAEHEEVLAALDSLLTDRQVALDALTVIAEHDLNVDYADCELRNIARRSLRKAGRMKSAATAKWEPRWPFGVDLVEVARPWLDAGAKWQAILDSSIPGSAPAVIARERLDYIDTQLARLNGR